MQVFTLCLYCGMSLNLLSLLAHSRAHYVGRYTEQSREVDAKNMRSGMREAWCYAPGTSKARMEWCLWSPHWGQPQAHCWSSRSTWTLKQSRISWPCRRIGKGRCVYYNKASAPRRYPPSTTPMKAGKQCKNIQRNIWPYCARKSHLFNIPFLVLSMTSLLFVQCCIYL